MLRVIKTISTDKKVTWSNKTFLTFDLDWAHDEIIKDTINLVEEAGASATWFVTHNTKVLKKLCLNKDFEIGIHPNFNNLLAGDHSNGSSVSDILERLLEICPSAVSVRSHSLFQSERILDIFLEKNLIKISNTFIPGTIPSYPWKL